MFELLLMRHAKSDWANDLADHDRPLNDRGRKDALNMAEYLDRSNLVPDRMIISSAERTRETASLLLDKLSVADHAIIIEQDLYLASYRSICDIASHYAADGLRILLLAHNPGMDDAVFFLSNKRPALTANGKLMPTCSIAHFEFDSIDDIHRAGSGRLLNLLRPKELF